MALVWLLHNNSFYIHAYFYSREANDKSTRKKNLKKEKKNSDRWKEKHRRILFPLTLVFFTRARLDSCIKQVSYLPAPRN